MRIADVNINGKMYPAAFSLRVLADLEDRTGKPAGEALEAMLSNTNIHDAAWLLAQLLRAGQAASGSAQTPPDEDALLDLIGIDDIFGFTAGILASVRDIAPRIPTEPVKKPKAKRRLWEALTSFG